MRSQTPASDQARQLGLDVPPQSPPTCAGREVGTPSSYGERRVYYHTPTEGDLTCAMSREESF